MLHPRTPFQAIVAIVLQVYAPEQAHGKGQYTEIHQAKRQPPSTANSAPGPALRMVKIVYRPKPGRNVLGPDQTV